jgi:uncharacterized protein YbjT (DUF2867 family)
VPIIDVLLRGFKEDLRGRVLGTPCDRRNWNVGGAVVRELLKRGAEVRVLARKQPEEGYLPAEAEVAIGDLMDPVSLEKAMDGVDKVFLLNAVVADELTQALITYDFEAKGHPAHHVFIGL